MLASTSCRSIPIVIGSNYASVDYKSTLASCICYVVPERKLIIFCKSATYRSFLSWFLMRVFWWFVVFPWWTLLYSSQNKIYQNNLSFFKKNQTKNLCNYITISYLGVFVQPLCRFERGQLCVAVDYKSTQAVFHSMLVRASANSLFATPVLLVNTTAMH